MTVGVLNTGIYTVVVVEKFAFVYVGVLFITLSHILFVLLVVTLSDIFFVLLVVTLSNIFFVLLMVMERRTVWHPNLCVLHVEIFMAFISDEIFVSRLIFVLEIIRLLRSVLIWRHSHVCVRVQLRRGPDLVLVRVSHPVIQLFRDMIDYLGVRMTLRPELHRFLLLGR